MKNWKEFTLLYTLLQMNIGTTYILQLYKAMKKQVQNIYQYKLALASNW